MRVGQGGGGASQRSEFKQCFLFFFFGKRIQRLLLGSEFHRPELCKQRSIYGCPPAGQIQSWEPTEECFCIPACCHLQLPSNSPWLRRGRGKRKTKGEGGQGLQCSLRVASLLCLCPTTEDASILFIAVGVGWGGDYQVPGMGHIQSGL